MPHGLPSRRCVIICTAYVDVVPFVVGVEVSFVGFLSKLCCFLVSGFFFVSAAGYDGLRFVSNTIILRI